MIQISAVVVLFNPIGLCIQNMSTYFSHVDHLIITDNSMENNSSLLNEFLKNPKVKYVFNGKNLGVTTPINFAARYSIQRGFDFLLTMDQDTSVDSDFIEIYKNFLNSNNYENVGILSPLPSYTNQSKYKFNSKEVNVAITSGSLINLKIFEKVGPYSDNLFIDYADFEYCLRVRKNGFKIIQLSKAKIYHQLGNLEKRAFLFKSVYVTHHAPLRYYYRTRNRMYIAKEYFATFPLFVIKDFFIFINEVLKIFVFENSKFEKIKMIMLGIKDFLRNKYGKFQNDFT